MKRLTIIGATALALLAAGVLGQASLAAPTVQTVRVTETSYRIKLSARPKAGVVKFVVRNASDDAHDPPPVRPPDAGSSGSGSDRDD